MTNPLDRLANYQSLPNIRTNENTSELDMRRLYSLSLSQIRKHSALAEYHHKPTPFYIRWIYGYNPKVGVINLNDRGTTTVFYAAANCAVLYNWTTNQMRILQGHRHTITCIASDSTGKWLVTADSGPENILIIWDSTDYFPQKTIFSPHGDVKVARVALSPDAKYLLTLGYAEQTTVYWWIWSFGLGEPHATVEVDISKDAVIDMGFNANDTQQFLLMTKHDIWLGLSKKVFIIDRGVTKETNDYEIKMRKVPKAISPDCGKLTCFTFVGVTSHVLVGTSRGAILIFGYTIEYQEDVEPTNIDSLRFVKVLKVEKHRINIIKCIDDVIVTGNDGGEIHFYDSQLKLLYWVHGFTVDNVKDISFNISPRSFQIFDPKCNKACPCWEKVVSQIDPLTGVVKQKLIKRQLPSDATVGSKPFLVRDFIVCTQNQGVGYVDFVTENYVTIIDHLTSTALAITMHPEKPFMCVGYADGVLELYKYIPHKLFVRLDLRKHFTVVTPPRNDSFKFIPEMTVPQLSVTCLKYSPSGLHLACGLNTGELLFLDPTTINIITEKPFLDTHYAIKEINYSCDSLTLACADAGRTVLVYKYDCETFKWAFIGKHRSHFKDITSVFFLPKKNADGEYKLVSLGADKIMVEYDIGQSSEEYLEIFSLDRVDQTAIPLCGIVWPTPKDLDPTEQRTDLPTILIANDEHKYKIVNYSTTMTLATILGPRYEHPVKKMQLVTREEDGVELQYLVFATKNIIGIQKMPLDGNPWKHVGLLAHPVQVTDMCFRGDNGVMFTIGAKDPCVFQWAANYRSVETTTKQGGPDLDPYYCLVENGRPGWLFQEIRDLFYYVQILCQGTFSPATRRVKDYIPIESLPDLMRALGFFPSEYEVENLLEEARYKVYSRDAVAEIDFEEFVKLYLNHRPAFGCNFKKLKKAFLNFAYFQNDEYKMHRDQFIEMLQTYGEQFSRDLSWYLLSILCGHSFEDRAALTEGDFSFLPEEITFSYLVNNIIGIQDSDNISDDPSGMEESAGSQSQQTPSSGDSQDKY